MVVLLGEMEAQLSASEAVVGAARARERLHEVHELECDCPRPPAAAAAAAAEVELQGERAGGQRQQREGGIAGAEQLGHCLFQSKHRLKVMRAWRGAEAVVRAEREAKRQQWLGEVQKFKRMAAKAEMEREVRPPSTLPLALSMHCVGMHPCTCEAVCSSLGRGSATNVCAFRL